MRIDRERLALALVNSDREMAGLPTVESRETISNSDGYCINADAILADIEAQGFVIVPRTPSENMLIAGEENNPTSWSDDTDFSFPAEVALEVWRAMVDAATSEKEKAR